MVPLTQCLQVIICICATLGQRLYVVDYSGWGVPVFTQTFLAQTFVALQNPLADYLPFSAPGALTGMPVGMPVNS